MAAQVATFGIAGISPKNIPLATANRLRISNRGTAARTVLTAMGFKDTKPAASVVANVTNGKVTGTR